MNEYEKLRLNSLYGVAVVEKEQVPKEVINILQTQQLILLQQHKLGEVENYVKYSPEGIFNDDSPVYKYSLESNTYFVERIK